MNDTQVRQWLAKMWNEKPHHKLDWLQFEQFVSDVLHSEGLDSDTKLRAIAEGLDAFTRRGHFIDRNLYLSK